MDAEVLAEMVHRVLGHDDGRVDKDADRDGDPGERHDVCLDLDEPDAPQERQEVLLLSTRWSSIRRKFRHYVIILPSNRRITAYISTRIPITLDATLGNQPIAETLT